MKADCVGTAKLSSCRHYRYALWRRWANGPQVLFVMLNPSTADETADDPTIRRCMGFARSWGFGSIAVGNLFALRTPSPALLRKSACPVGRGNDTWLRKLQGSASLVLAAWGNHGSYLGRDLCVRGLLAQPHMLGLTKVGAPRHPLYVPSAAHPRLW